ncbi:MAG: helix-turn-helix transcriptional regulator [Clostridiales bacterium]|nr:helix-turn-helix transcriptional regulator [Clostridiales bacterium]
MLSERLKELRKEKGVTQGEIATLLGVDRSTYGKYEIGDSTPAADRLMWLAEYFDVTLDYLLGRSNFSSPSDAPPAETTTAETSYRKISPTRTSSAKDMVNGLKDSPDLLEFWDTLQGREDLQLLFKQTRDMSPKDIKQIIRIIKAIEEEEDREDK